MLHKFYTQKFTLGYSIKLLLGHDIFNKRMLVNVLIALELFKLYNCNSC